MISQKRKSDNNNFQNNQKKFYANLTKSNQSNIQQVLDAVHFETFWRNVWNNLKSHNLESIWLSAVPEYSPMDTITIEVNELKSTLKHFSNFTALGQMKYKTFC